jgi:hypothetical protein
MPVSNSEDKDEARQRLQSVIRLTSDSEKRDALIETLRKIYSEVPAYAKIPRPPEAPAGRKLLIGRAPAASSINRHMQIADELLFLGLFDEAAEEFEASSNRGNSGSQITAVLYNNGNKAYRILDETEPRFRGVPADYAIELLPREAADALYPAPYKDEILSSSAERNTDPRLLLAIIRQESRFRPSVKSAAAARGLMQFISTTSLRVAGELRLKNFRQDDLYDPAVAILFGSHYTGELFKLFPKKPDAVAASYNGGEENMRRWLNRSKSELPDRFVPEIMYSQTKDYVQKVMANYRVYQSLYDEKLTRR